MTVGQTIRTIREKKGLTLSDVAERADLTVGGLSQIERDLVNPTIPTLRRISIELGVPVFTLLMEQEDQEGIVVRSDRHLTFTSAQTNATYETLSPSTKQRFEVVRFSLMPGDTTANDPMIHPGEECVVILKGAMRLELGEQIIMLYAGDTAQFDSSIPHRYINVGDEEAEAIDVMSPPFT
ncbi:MAG: helix-turn-helix transcriptional regulator [Anaerolineales bacterium]|nr:helix-turn-helix transcriptional regulator [Anaerolineales bacterium]